MALSTPSSEYQSDRTMNTDDGSVLLCCICGDRLCEPVLLLCLHNCCQSCLVSHSAGTSSRQLTIKCPLCSELTELDSLVPNGFLHGYERVSALQINGKCCSSCAAADDKSGVNAAAEYWCVDCGAGLCTSCYSWHSRFTAHHRIVCLNASLKSSFVKSASQCTVHKQQLEMQCSTCCAPRCLVCFDSCTIRVHETRTMRHTETVNYASRAVAAIRDTVEGLRRRLASLAEKRRTFAGRLHKSRIDGAAALQMRRRMLLSATSRMFDTSLGVVCFMPLTCVADKVLSLSEAVQSAARHTALLPVASAQTLGSLLVEMRLLKVAFHRHTSTAGTSRCLLQEKLRDSSTLSGDTTLPLTADLMFSTCVGAVRMRSNVPLRTPLLFPRASASFRTPVDCVDVAVTQNGRLLLAAFQRGLLVYCKFGRQLSVWRPPKRSDGRDDLVVAVALLSDGRAAAGVFHSRLVVLLRRSATGDVWQEDRRLAPLQSPPRRLAAYGGVIAVAEHRRHERQQQNWVAGRHVALLRISSGQPLYRQTREYDLQSVAITAMYLVTSSRGPVNVSGGILPYVVDSFTHAGRLVWRYEACDDQIVRCIFAATETLSRIYVCEMTTDWSSSRVTAIEGARGTERQTLIASDTHGLRSPWWLSLARGQHRSLLAVLCCDKISKQVRTVIVYEATT